MSLFYIHVPWTIAGGQHGCDAFGLKRTYSWLERELEPAEGGVKGDIIVMTLYASLTFSAEKLSLERTLGKHRYIECQMTETSQRY